MLEWLTVQARTESLDAVYGTGDVKEQILALLARTHADISPVEERHQGETPPDTDGEEPPPELCYRPTFGPLR